MLLGIPPARQSHMCTKCDHSSFSPFQIYCWCPPKFKWFTWPDNAPFRDSLSSLG